MRFVTRLLASAALVAAPLVAAPLAAHPGKAHAAAAAAVEKRSVDVPASNGRVARLSVWATRSAKPRGVVVFGHGMGGTPEAYQPLLTALLDHGYSIVAPLAVDSLSHPDRAKFDAPQGFAARVEDLMIARGLAASTFPGLKVALAGHSYGSLFALIGAGAKSPAGPLQGPPVAAVLALSTPGRIPGLVAPDAFASVSTPLMIVTGTSDLVPGFVADARDHRLAFDTAKPGADYLLTVPGGGHDLMIKGDARLRQQLTVRAIQFLDAYVAGDARALAALKSGTSPLYRMERR